ncbi:MAG: sulfocyanin-like copper-binding protein [Alphaproteobacteria bacterium]
MRGIVSNGLLGAGALALIVVAPALAAERIVPSWLTFDEAKNTVKIEIVAAYNGNNGSWNFNGYSEGGMTVVIPLGAKVRIDFKNPDGNYPHSLIVSQPFAPDAFPNDAGREQVGIPRAYSSDPREGCLACTDSLRFKAKKPGVFHLLCGVAGHAQAGMWDHFTVSAEAKAPYVTIADDALGPEDQPGYP